MYSYNSFIVILIEVAVPLHDSCLYTKTRCLAREISTGALFCYTFADILCNGEIKSYLLYCQYGNVCFINTQTIYCSFI